MACCRRRRARARHQLEEEVTVPIRAWVAAIIFEIAAAASNTDSHMFAAGSYWLIGLGMVGAVVAALFGLMDLMTIPRRTPAFKVGLTHMRAADHGLS